MVTYCLPACKLHPTYDGVMPARTKKPCTCVALHTAFKSLISPEIQRKFEVRIGGGVIAYRIAYYRRVRRSRTAKTQS